MVRLITKNNIKYLYVGFHEWAFSLRTTGFPVYAITKTDKGYGLVKIGKTHKRPTTYRLPPNTIAVVRKYYSNGGYLTLYVYEIPSLKMYSIWETHNFAEVNELPENLRQPILGIIEAYISR